MTEMRNDDDQSQTIYINIYFRKFEFELCMYEYSLGYRFIDGVTNWITFK